MTWLFFLLATWLLASIPTGVVVGTLYADVDVTRQGSGNIGATNVTRLLGRRYGAATLAGDLAKGFVPVLLAPLVHPGAWFAGLVALTAFAGHCWSAYLDFRGGKGVATAAGAMLALAPLATLLAATAWMLSVMAWRKASLGALLAAVLLQVLVLAFNPGVLWVSLLLGGGIVLRHKDNIRRLRDGSER